MKREDHYDRVKRLLRQIDKELDAPCPLRHTGTTAKQIRELLMLADRVGASLSTALRNAIPWETMAFEPSQ
jgi:hypothetical protein